MKRVFLLSIVLSIGCAINAQTAFSVPTPTMEEKYSLAKNFMYNNILTAVAVTKEEGMTAEELGRKCGEIYAPAWDAETDFEEFVNAVMYHYSCLSDNLQIVEQSKEKVVLIASPIYPILENRGVFFDTSLEELVAFLNSVYGEIANHFNLNCDMSWVDEGLRIEMTQ